MSVRSGLLTLLDQQPMHGYQLRQQFESSTGATWPLNIGQVYTTLARLERDGLVEVSDDGDETQRVYTITPAGHDEVTRWFATPVPREAPPRDELAIKLALAVRTPGVDVRAVIQTQRTATVRSLQAYTRAREAASSDLSWLLVADSLIFAAEAEVRWLDHCETRLARVRPSASHRTAPVTAPVLELRAVRRTHRDGDREVVALDGVSLQVAPGELVAVMGPSGSGKSTLLNLAGGLDSPTGGEVVVDGLALGRLTRSSLARLRRRRIGYVFQSLNLIASLTAVENVMLPRELDGVGAGQARREALAVLEQLGLQACSDRFPDDLSGGQQQRVAIARAVAGERRLILADEPTGALDSQTGEEVLRLLRGRCDAGAVGAVLVTHDARHAGWADRVVFLRDGVIVDETPAVGSVESLLTSGSE